MVAINPEDKCDWLNLPFSLSQGPLRWNRSLIRTIYLPNTGICEFVRLAVLILICSPTKEQLALETVLSLEKLNEEATRTINQFRNHCRPCSSKARTIQPILEDSMEILITFLKKMPILEPHRITTVVLKIYKVINCVYHILKIYQFTEFKIVLIGYSFSSLSTSNIREFSHLSSQSTVGLWPKLIVGNIKSQISAFIISTR